MPQYSGTMPHWSSIGPTTFAAQTDKGILFRADGFERHFRLPQLEPVTAGTIDEDCVVVAGAGGTTLWRINPYAMSSNCLLIGGGRTHVSALAASPFTSTLVVGTSEGHAFAVRTTANAELDRLEKGDPVTAVAVASRTPVMAAARANGRIDLFNSGGGPEPIGSLTADGAVRALCMCDIGYRLAALVGDELVVYDMISRNETQRSQGFAGYATICFEPGTDGRLRALRTMDLEAVTVALEID